jgi:hypothetical protein
LIRMKGIEEQEAHSWREKGMDLSLVFTSVQVESYIDVGG